MKLNQIANRIDGINQELAKEGYSAALQEVWKNGGLMTCLQIRDHSRDICPTVYELPDRLESMTDEEISEYLIDLYNENKIEINVAEITNHDYVINNVTMRLVSGKNKEDIKDENILYRDFEDMLILYVVPVKVETKQFRGSITMKKDFAKNIHVTEEELHESAMKNIMETYEIKTMLETLAQMTGMTADEVEELGVFPNDNDLYVVSNKDKVHGAAVICSEEVQREIWNRIGEDYFVLPSSVHEVLAVAASVMDKNYAQEMVANVNSTEVDAVDRLTDSVYLVHMCEDKISFAKVS